MADLHFEKATDLASVLWQNGLLGYVDETGRRRFYSIGDVEEFHFPPEVATYVLHPCLVATVGGIRHVGADTPGARAARRASPPSASSDPATPHGVSSDPATPPGVSPDPTPPPSDPPGASTAAWPAGGSEPLPEPDPAEVQSSAAAKAADYTVGDILEGRFEILGVLGQGGFSKVYRVHDGVEGTDRALKLFNSAAGYEAVRREIGALRKIRHPNVVEVFWAGKTNDGDWYLITEFIDGEPLSEFATGKKHLRDREAVDVALDLLDALTAFHPDAARLHELEAKNRAGSLSGPEQGEWMELKDAGLVHRDIKPLNVMLTRAGAKLLDFNIASRVGDPVRTQSGTPPYQPPDAGLTRWDVSTDLFAVGVLLYQLLCDGRHPFQNAMPMAGQAVIDPKAIRPDLTPGLAEFLIRACAPANGDRFASAAEMWQALRDLRANL
jgi:hypothetical protein